MVANLPGSRCKYILTDSEDGEGGNKESKDEGL